MHLSIVIPTFNRAVFLQKTLQSITDQHFDDQLYEVIVIDNGSKDETKAVCDYFRSRLTNLVYYYDEEPGQLTGRHKGTELSTGSIISFIDDDVELNSRWIESVLRLFEENNTISIIGGPSLARYHEYPPLWVKHFWQPTPYGGSMCLPLSLIDLGCKQVEIDPLYVFGLNYSIRKKVLLELGGFHPDCIPQQFQQYQGDGETGLSLRAKNRGVKALYSDVAFLYHQVPGERLTMGYFEKWYYYNGVCQSFTDIRSAHFKDQFINDNSKTASIINRMVIETGNVVRNVISKNKSKFPDYILQLQSDFAAKYHEGYRFHQLSFQMDANVRSWVLKEDYWNYKLPV